MRTTFPAVGPISWTRRLMPAAAAWALGSLLVFSFARTAAAQDAAAAGPPLTFENNFFVTGDYVVAGAYGMTSHIQNGFAIGTINVPDKDPVTGIMNPGITGTTQVPAGAEILAALLFWQTVEKVNAAPSDTGQNGFFGPVFNNVPQLYAITGVPVTNHSTVSFSNGGCSGGSTGKIVKTYRAAVTAYLPQDQNGIVQPNTTFQVRLPSTGNTTPITLGATLVLIYRILSPNVPLNSIVIYDGAFAPSSTTTLNMSQTVQGFYQAGLNGPAGQTPLSRLTHIVGSGQSNKFQTVYLNNKALTPSLYGSGRPEFVGYYGGTWDTVTRTFPDARFPGAGVQENDSSATTMVVPSGSQMGCVSWGAVIVSTTVKNNDNDGHVDVWKNNPKSPGRPGYCDAAVNEGVCNPGDPSWVDLPGAAPGQQDVFVQLDYMCTRVIGAGQCDTSARNDVLDPRLTKDPGDMNRNPIDKVVDAFAAKYKTNHPAINLHVIQGHALEELTCKDDLSKVPPSLCAYPNPQSGVVGWKGGLVYLKNQPVDPNDQWCTTNPPAANCVAVFQHGKKDSYHEAMFSHGLGLPSWALRGGTLTSVSQTGNAVTFTTLTPHGLSANANCAGDGNGNERVTVGFAVTNTSLNGTFCVQSAGPGGALSTTFTIHVATPTSKQVLYTTSTDPNLEAGNGVVGTVSGFSDIAGQDSLITVDSWGADATVTAKTGTFMHELGHAIGLTHSAFYYDIPGSFVPTVEVNCKTNLQTVMSYMYQIDLLDFGGPVNVPDYSGTMLPNVSKNVAPPPFGLLSYQTSWHGTKTQLRQELGPHVVDNATPLTLHCDGTSITDGAQLFRVTRPSTLLSWQAGQDVDFDGKAVEPPFRGHNDWVGTAMAPGVDLRQIGATGSLSAAALVGGGQAFGAGGGQAFGAGGGQAFGGGGGQAFGAGGGQVFGAGGGQAFGAGGGQAFGAGGGQAFGAGGGQAFGGGGGIREINRADANSYTRPPRNLKATSEDVSPRFTHLSWNAPVFGQIGAYRIYRSADGGTTFTLINTVPGNQLTYQDGVSTPPPCNLAGYQYYVTAVLAGTFVGSPLPNPPPDGQESVPSNVASTGQSGELLTGCYTFTGFSSPTAGSSAVQGTGVPITWSVQDFSNKSGAFVNNTAANTLVAIGPVNNDAVCASPTANTPRTTIAQSGAGITIVPGSAPNYQFSFNWNTTGFAAGCYLLELDLDSGQPNAGNQSVSAFQVLIYLSDVSLMVTTTSPLSAATETVAYNTILSESGGTVGGPVPFTWTVVAGALPNGMALGVALDGVSGALTGAPTTPGTYNFTVKVTDSIGDSGTKAFTLLVNALVSNTADSGAGSLRQAILDVNATQPGPQPLSILFKILGAGVQTISPITPLPAVTQPTILDATTQPVYAGTPLIELNGTNAGTPATGIHITAGNSTVRGLAIDSFNGNGILIDTNGGDVIQGNYIGTDKTGLTAAPNTGNGIQIIAVSNNAVGGPATSLRNIISGNNGEGVRIDGTLATGNVVRGNYIGTDVTGSNAVGNQASGVYIRRAPGNSVIGNTVSGNVGFAGITICGDQLPGPGFCGGGDVGAIDETSNASGNIIQGNLVGTNSSGTAALGNNQAGLSIDGAPNTVVGGTAAGAANTISFNGTNDVQIFDAGANGNQIKANTIQGSTTAATTGISVDASLIGNTLSQNSISGHAGLGIDVSPAGVNPNTTNGANNYPVISPAQASSGTIMGTLNGPANATFTIEFFSNSACNASGNGEGAVFLGSTTVTTDGSGNVVFAAAVAGLVAGNTITATSTHANGTTSEFSACVPVS